jgi:hypothetical protein
MAEKNSNSALQEFLTPEAMLTPGVAGSMTMMITNALALNFDLSRAWTGLVLSFIFGILVLVSAKGLLAKLAFYILNSLVIFCVALGANGVTTAAPASPSPPIVMSGPGTIRPEIRIPGEITKNPSTETKTAKTFFAPWTF